MIFSADRIPIYNKKTQFKSYLDIELHDCKYKVIVSYEWGRTGQVAALRVMDDRVLRIWINLNFYKDWLFGGSEKAQELSLRYRVYYISAYIRCLEEVLTSFPTSYHSGLVSLCAINDICSGKKVNSYSAVSEERLSKLRPIDVYCTAGALTRLVEDCQDILSDNEKDECNSIINSFLIYSLLPEISYEKGRPVYALLRELKKYRSNVFKGRNSEENFPLFEGCFVGDEEGSLPDLSMRDLINRATAIQGRNPFWSGAALRLILADERSFDIGAEKADSLGGCINNYRENSIRYYKEYIETDSVLLKDNYTAVRKLSNRMNSVFSAVAAETGVLHYYQ